MSQIDEFLARLAQSPIGIGLALVMAIVLLYLGRGVAHGIIRAVCSGLHGGLGAVSRQMVSAHGRLIERNREILLAVGRDAAERSLEREFHRVHTTVDRDLSGYPALQRRLSDQIQRIDEDYRKSTEVPPSPPEWVRAVDTIAAIPTNGDPFVGRILGDIHRTLTRAHEAAVRSYRKQSSERHRMLRRMLPYWRRLDRTLDGIDGTIRGLHDRSLAIDRQMESYEQIRAKSDEAARMLSASTTTHFISSSLVLFIALMGAFINFHLIALPMSEMVGASSHVGPVRTSDIAALVIILTEVAMGLFLMESLRITRLFPVIGMLDDQMRRRLAWVALAILTTLALVESSLAYMRDLLAADREALTASLAGTELLQAEFRWIPSIGQMVMGFMLPFALTFVAIPLESFIQSSRSVVGNLMALGLRSLAGAVDLAAGLARALEPVLTNTYDFVIAIPLRLEQQLHSRRGSDVSGRTGRIKPDRGADSATRELRDGSTGEIPL